MSTIQGPAVAAENPANRHLVFFGFLGLLMASVANGLPVTTRLAYIKPLIFVFSFGVGSFCVLIKVMTRGVSVWHLVGSFFVLGLLLIGVANGYLLNHGEVRGYIAFTLSIVLLGGLLGTNRLSDVEVFGAATAAFIVFQVLLLVAFISPTFGGMANAVFLVDITNPEFLIGYQLVSKTTASAAILCAAYYHRNRNFLVLLLVWVLIAAAFFGGGRGEAIFGLLIVLLILPKRTATGSVAVLLTLAVFNVGTSLIAESAVFVRIAELLQAGDIGPRGELLLDALDLASDRPSAWVWGLGANGFQHLTAREFGLYPHNVIVESLLTSGLLLPLVMVAFVGMAFFNLLRAKRASNWLVILFYGHLLYLFAVAFKSGSLWRSWLFFLVIIVAPTVLLQFGKSKLEREPQWARVDGAFRAARIRT